MPFFGVPIRNGLPIGLGSVAGFGVQQFDPSQLFEGGTVAGAWYDPSDLSTMFDSSAGTTPVAMPGQGAPVPVGLMLDKSQGLVLGSELVTNGDFNTNLTGWSNGVNMPAAGTAVWNAGALRLTRTSNTVSYQQAITTVVGKWYFVSGLVTFVSGTGEGAIFKTDSASSIAVNAVSGGPSAGQSGIASFYFCATATTTYIHCVTGTTNNTVYDFDVVTVKELAGNHAIAANDSTKRPVLMARVNLLVATATLSTQSVTTQATSYTLRFAGTGSITLSGTATGSYSAGTHTITCTAGTLTLTVSGTVTTADLRPANFGALLPAYQAVVDANTYDTSGFPLYLRFDGIDDSMYTPANLNLSGTDKVAVFAGVRKLSDTAGTYPLICEFSADWNVNDNCFALFAGGASAGQYFVGIKGTTRGWYEPQTYSAPISNVLCAQYNLSGANLAAQIVPRVNGLIEQENPNGSSGTPANFGTYPLFIGSRNNASFRLDGHLHSLIIAGSAVSAGNISATEQWVAGKTGIAL